MTTGHRTSMARHFMAMPAQTDREKQISDSRVPNLKGSTRPQRLEPFSIVYRNSTCSSQSHNVFNPSDYSPCITSLVAISPLCEGDHIIGDCEKTRTHTCGWCNVVCVNVSPRRPLGQLCGRGRLGANVANVAFSPEVCAHPARKLYCSTTLRCQPKCVSAPLHAHKACTCALSYMRT